MNSNLHIDNRSLVKECLNGDREALNLFYNRFAPRMLGLIYRYVNNLRDAEDILHDGFIIAFTRLADLQDYDRVEYWLASIMKNLSLKFLSNQDVSTVLHQLSDLPDITDTPDINEFLNLEVLESLIKKLPSGYQSVFRLAVLEGKTHKEIGELLGITPNTSSSQLFHAKMMMRRLITDYQRQIGLFVLFLILGAGIIALLDVGESREKRLESREEGRETRDKSLETRDKSVETREESLGSREENRRLMGEKRGENAQLAREERQESRVQSVESREERQESRVQSVETREESIESRVQSVESREKRVTENNVSQYYAVAENARHSARNRSAWNIGVGIDPGVASLDNSESLAMDNIGTSFPGDDPDKDKPDKDKEEEKSGVFAKQEAMASTRSAVAPLDYNSVKHHNYMPISFTLSAQRIFSDRFGVEAGLTYSFLHSTFEGVHSRSEGYWHYLGIPVKLNLRTFEWKRFKMYGSVGARMDIPLYSNMQVTTNKGYGELWSGHFRARMVWSLSASYGFSFRISEKTDIFIEPTIQYHFKNSQPVPHIWSDNRWNISLPIGFRFSW